LFFVVVVVVGFKLEHVVQIGGRKSLLLTVLQGPRVNSLRC